MLEAVPSLDAFYLKQLEMRELDPWRALEAAELVQLLEQLEVPPEFALVVEERTA